MSGALAGLRILDLTAVMLGPIATQILGDYGADVIKVEGPEGDLMRANGVSLHAGMGSIFLAVNRNKRSLALDLKKEEGRAVLRRLVRGADVLVHNMRIEAIERLGFGYARSSRTSSTAPPPALRKAAPRAGARPSTTPSRRPAAWRAW